MENENRVYKRANHLNCVIKISEDGIIFKEERSRDISSGGISIISDTKYEIGKELYFILDIMGVMNEFTVFVKGDVVRVTKLSKNNSYGIKFKGLDENTKIRIDESISKDRIVDTYINNFE